mgnify:FL=1
MYPRPTQFQQRLMADTEAIEHIVSIFHPDAPKFYRNNKNVKTAVVYEPTYKYNWVCIYRRIRGYGVIDICIKNDQNHTICGSGHGLIRFEKARENGELSLDAWRIVLDKLYKQRDYDKPDHDQEAIDKTVKYLLNRSYDVIQTNEWYDSYYRD